MVLISILRPIYGSTAVIPVDAASMIHGTELRIMNPEGDVS
jgi:hypothetical protein